MDYKPFKDTTELTQWFIKRYKVKKLPKIAEPLLWLKKKENGEECLVTGFSGTKDSVYIISEWVKVEKLFEEFTFLDGEPCGMPEGLPEPVEVAKKPVVVTPVKKKRVVIVRRRPVPVK